jgi:ankyrin repeat protein
MQHLAAAEGHEKMVEYLLMSQANPNCKDRWGGTPLQVLQA